MENKKVLLRIPTTPTHSFRGVDSSGHQFLNAQMAKRGNEKTSQKNKNSIESNGEGGGHTAQLFAFLFCVYKKCVCLLRRFWLIQRTNERTRKIGQTEEGRGGPWVGRGRAQTRKWMRVSDDTNVCAVCRR